MAGTSLNSIVRGRAQGLILADTSQHQISRSVFATLALCETKRLARAHTAAIHSLSIDAVQHRYILSTGTDTSIQLFDLESTGQINPTRCVLAGSGHTNTVTSVEWYSVDNGMFSTASLDHTVKIWDAHAMTEASQFDLECRVFSQKMSPTGAHALIAAGCESPYIRLCDLRSGAFAQSLLAHESASMAVDWSPVDAYMLASGGTDGRLQLWDIRQAGSHVCDFGNSESNTCAHDGSINGLLFTDDGQRLVSAGFDHCARVWNTASPQTPTVEIQTGAENDKPRTSTTLSTKTVEMALTTATDGTTSTKVLFIPSTSTCEVLVVDVCTGEVITRLDAHFASVTCAAWRPSFGELYTGGADSNVVAWSMREVLDSTQAALRTNAWSDSEPDDNV
ncbi:hypothetical protein GGH19_005483 [Coemansia sp. RSA 1807]|nr:hypothetical protein GGH19_005483 [Coemansia sp. RSA 1807]